MEWKPIETLPDDHGRFILAYNDRGTKVTVFATIYDGQIDINDKTEHIRLTIFKEGDPNDTQKLLGWIPMPEPPSSKIYYCRSCPFCRRDITPSNILLNGNHYYISCNTCGARGPLEACELDATKSWNNAQRK